MVDKHYQDAMVALDTTVITMIDNHVDVASILCAMGLVVAKLIDAAALTTETKTAAMNGFIETLRNCFRKETLQ